ncbi:ACT domain-containing protein, partial [Staphylococcus saprophyticus]
IIMRSNQIKNKENEVLSAIRKKCDIDELSIDHDLAILMIVGEGMTQSVGTANKITHALAESNINLKMINQGASEISMMFGISRENADKAVLST